MIVRKLAISAKKYVDIIQRKVFDSSEKHFKFSEGSNMSHQCDKKLGKTRKQSCPKPTIFHSH